MKLPLRLRHDYYGKVLVTDVNHKIVLSADYAEIKAARAIVRKFNRDWRWRLFGWQPYEYTREDWLFEKNRGQIKA